MNALAEGPLGKLLALTVLLLLLAVGYLAAVQPLIGLYDSREQSVAERGELAQRLRGAGQDLPRLRALAEQWRQSSREGELLLAGSSDAVAAAALQSTVKELVTTGGAILSSAEILPAQTQENFRRVGIRVAFSGDLKLLTEVLQGIETAHPKLLVDNLEIRSGGDPESESGPVLTVTLEVYGFRGL